MANENREMSDEGRSQLYLSEGFVAGYYNDVAANCTYGIGTLVHYGPCTAEEMDRAVIRNEANIHFERDIRQAEGKVRSIVTDHELTQEQFDAAVSFAYNSTTHNTRRTLEHANRGDMAAVAHSMRQNVYIIPRDRNRNVIGPAVRVQGLVNRRRRESAPFDE